MFNTYNGSVYQQAISALTYTDSANYGGNGYGTYGFEWWSDEDNRDDGYVQWTSTGTPSWKITADSVGPDSSTQVSQRLISEEPHVSNHTLQYSLRNFLLGMPSVVHNYELGHVTEFPGSRL